MGSLLSDCARHIHLCRIMCTRGHRCSDSVGWHQLSRSKQTLQSRSYPLQHPRSTSESRWRSYYMKKQRYSCELCNWSEPRGQRGLVDLECPHLSEWSVRNCCHGVSTFLVSTDSCCHKVTIYVVIECPHLPLYSANICRRRVFIFVAMHGESPFVAMECPLFLIIKWPHTGFHRVSTCHAMECLYLLPWSVHIGPHGVSTFVTEVPTLVAIVCLYQWSMNVHTDHSWVSIVYRLKATLGVPRSTRNIADSPQPMVTMKWPMLRTSEQWMNKSTHYEIRSLKHLGKYICCFAFRMFNE